MLWVRRLLAGISMLVVLAAGATLALNAGRLAQAASGLLPVQATPETTRAALPSTVAPQWTATDAVTPRATAMATATLTAVPAATQMATPLAAPTATLPPD